MAKYAQKILFFFCRPCGDYHEKTNPALPRDETAQGQAALRNRATARAELPRAL
jgi:hypothetical protein